MDNKILTLKESLIFTQRMAQLSKALWKAIEKDWQKWIKPFDLNINEHHILWISYHLDGATVSDIAKFGVMHVSTAFNFSKKLEDRGLLHFSKRECDKRNTYIQLTEKGENLLLEIMEEYEPENNSVLQGALPLREMYGQFPDCIELMTIIRNIHGDDFMKIFEKSVHNIETRLDEKDGNLSKVQVESLVNL